MNILLLILAAQNGGLEKQFEGAWQAPSPDHIGRLVRQLDSSDIEAREDAARRLKQGGEQTILALQPLLKSSQPELVIRAREILNWIDVDSAIGPNLKREMPGIVDRLAASKPEIWTEVLFAARKLCGKEDDLPARLELGDLVPLIDRAVKGASTDEQQKYVCKIVSEAHHRSSRGDVTLLLKDGSSAVRAQAAWTLGVIGEDEDSQVLLEMSRNRKFNVRVGAIKGLGCLGNPKHVPAITAFLNDENRHVKVAAIESLAQLKAIELLPRIIRCAGDTEWLVRYTAQDWFIEMGGVKLEKAISPFLHADEAVMRRGAIRALFTIGAKAQFGTIAKLLKDADVKIREAAILYLGDLDAQDYVEYIRPCLNDESSSVMAIRLNAVIPKWCPHSGQTRSLFSTS